MKIFKRFQFVVLLVLLLPFVGIAQTPVPLGASSKFVLFSIPGPVGNTGSSHITGDVGTSAGSSTGFGNINGQFRDGAAQNTATTASVGANYISLGTQPTTGVLPVLFGNGSVLTPGVYEQTIASTLAGELILDGLNLPDPCFVFKISAAMSANPAAKITLINGAQACNIFWKIGGALTTGTGVTLKGNFFVDGAIGLATGCKLEGRAFSISGAIQVSSTVATAPLGCGVAPLIGPIAPPLGAASCFSLLTGVGQLTNTGITHIGGHVGTNNGPVTGFNPLFVDSIHSTPDTMTARGTSAINTLYTTLIAMPCDIDMFDPAAFGHSQVLTPHVYCFGSATHLVDTIFLDAQGSADAVFVFIMNGAFTTATFANIVLRGGAQAKNVFWAVNGLVTVLSSSNMVGNIVSTGAITLNGCNLDGRAFSTAGAIIVSDLDLTTPGGGNPVIITGGNFLCAGDSLQLSATISTNYLWSTGDTTQNIMIYTGGNYSVIATDDCGKKDTSNTIAVTLNPEYNINLNTSICQGDSIFLAGAFRKIPGIYTDSLNTLLGCDSVIATNLQVNPIPITNSNAAICEGDSIFLAGAFRTLPGIYSDTLISQFTCDSIVNTDLIVRPIFITNANAEICQGDSILIAGAFRKLPGLYSDTLASQFTCDSIINTNLTVRPVFITTSNLAICEGDSIFLAGQFRKLPGLYSDTLASQFTCDSIINTNLNVNPIYTTNLNASICEGDSILIGGVYRLLAATYIENFSSSFGCDSTVNTTLIVNALPVTDAGRDTTIITGQSVLLGSSEIIGNTYSWSPTTALDQPSSAQVNANPTLSITYTLTVTNTITGCINTDTVRVNVNPNFDVEFFNGFSPNGDGFNDFWRIPILSLYPSNSVLIINRWGNEVWKGTDYDNLNNVWTGKNMKGDDLPDGTYFYHINYSGVDKQGWVFIKR